MKKGEIDTMQKHIEASFMLLVLPREDNEVDIINLIRHSFKLFIYNRLQRQEVSSQ